ncbi:hypothetical protein EIP91_009010 [Steccherinum ochraceum]|uniref:WLM domain-containing protein n=1 Tax=Steccherinum ochraceum TaxID=92696 RepID=A0A4R0RFE0_9APHY|nr:hypothetical protein EIP91_009010 [Steccherinum ochraceum]
MVHVRLNPKETNPNPHINFIAPLPIDDATAREDSRQFLRALAAQVRPVMKSHGFVINSFEEYEYNSVFAGRNWNNGETVEIVLRGPTGAYYSSSWLLGTLCHELAHIKALWSRLRREVGQLQSKGYFGDGYWSSGQRLADSAVVGGMGEVAGALPEYMCGGAHSRQRPSTFRRRRPTQKRRTIKRTFKGEGHALNEDVSDEEEKKKGTGFRKKAGSKRAREERAAAVEKRVQALLGKTGPSSEQSSSDDDDSEGEGEEETDKDRRRAMLDTVPQSDLDALKTSRNTFIDEFFFPASSSQPEAGPSRPRPTVSSVAAKRKQSLRQSTLGDGGAVIAPSESLSKPSTSSTSPPKKKQKLGPGESLASTPLGSVPRRGDRDVSVEIEVPGLRTNGNGWACTVCTLWVDLSDFL